MSNSMPMKHNVVIYNANYEKGKEKGKEIANQILEQLSLDETISVAELAHTLSSTEKTIRYHMNKMREKGILKREGSTKKGKWIIKK